MKKVTVFTILISAFSVFSSAQSLSEINSKYKKFNGSSAAYVFNEKIWFSVEKSASGKACTMMIFPKRNLDERLNFTEFLSALDSIIPSDKRGGKEDSFISVATGGGFLWTTFQYENVDFTFPQEMNLSRIRELKEFSFSKTHPNISELSAEEQTGSQKINIDEFAAYRKSDFNSASVRWKSKECSAK